MSERVQIIHADCRNAVRDLADASIDSVVTDGPYALVSIVKRFGGANAAPAKAKDGGSGVYMRASAGFMGQRWDTGEVYFDVAFWREIFRALKPGGHVAAFAGTRTYHRLAVAIEDAGFEIRDMIGWLYGSGFPKSHDVSKAIDKHLGAEREKVRHEPRPETSGTMANGSDMRPWIEEARERGFHETSGPIPATAAAAAAWDGWGTALKPSQEPICFARKPLIGTVAAAHRSGQDSLGVVDFAGRDPASLSTFMAKADLGRWPANIVHDGSDDVLAIFPETKSGKSPRQPQPCQPNGKNSVYGEGMGGGFHPGFPDGGSAARFFYTAKADADDRMGSRHPTVKPLDLMRWLVRLITPPGGLVLDPFAGSGTTGIAAMAEQCRAVLIEREESYIADIRIRIDHATGKGAHSGALKARRKATATADTPLFGAAE